MVLHKNEMDSRDKEIINKLKNINILGEKNNINHFLSKRYEIINSCYLLSHVPEQSEWQYVLLVNGSKIVRFSVSLLDETITDVNETDPESYYEEIRRSKHSKRWFEVAIALANNKNINSWGYIGKGRWGFRRKKRGQIG